METESVQNATTSIKKQKTNGKPNEAIFKVSFRGAGMVFETSLKYSVSSEEDFMNIQDKAYVALGKSVRDFVNKAKQEQ